MKSASSTQSLPSGQPPAGQSGLSDSNFAKPLNAAAGQTSAMPTQMQTMAAPQSTFQAPAWNAAPETPMQSTQPMQIPTQPQAPQAPQTGGGGVDEIMQMLKQQQPSVSQQAYASMMGGGFYGGILPHGSMGMSPIKAPNPPAQSAVQNQMSFGASPWPGAWGS